MTDQSPLQLKSQKFRETREKDWRALARQIDRAEKGELGRFSTEELLNLPVLYRSTVSSLSMAQSISLDRNLITFLQALCGRAYVYMYGSHARLNLVLARFFMRVLPQSFRRLGVEMWLSFACFFLGAIGGALMCALDPSWYNALVDPRMAGGRTPSASAEYLRSTLGSGRENMPLGSFSAMLMTHNTQVTLMVFAMGVIGGVPTAFLLMVNGMMLGAMVWLFASKGLGLEFIAWLSIHGTTEILAILMGGAAGFHLARRLMFPGHLTRKAALAVAGRTAGTVMLGAMLMLVLAGVIEGVGRQTITEIWGRYAVGIGLLLWWLAYYLMFGREHRGAARGEKA